MQFQSYKIADLINSVHDKKITEDDFDVEAELANVMIYELKEELIMI